MTGAKVPICRAFRGDLQVVMPRATQRGRRHLLRGRAWAPLAEVDRAIERGIGNSALIKLNTRPG